MLPFDLDQREQRDSIQCYTNGFLVYVRNLKCASTFFGSSFEKCWRWEPILWRDIDWGTQHVFGHMLDPLERRFKGLAEYINMHDLGALFEKDKKFQNFVKNAVTLDEHTSSYHDTFGNFVYHIDWIPISDYSHEQVIDFTERLLRQYGIRTLKNWAYDNVHRTHPEKKAVEQQLKKLCEEQGTWPQTVSWYLERDVALYRHISNKFNAEGETWAETTWLRLK
ncbi:hypothetical protein UFOVP328_72 [uncultured Caudovirales phage]|uniref:Uncharacterized protein n=1 Tax=uncultured Caudovirales phage TaxID=2100421 RepID=A0A6J5LUD1_9CAUD|nr:hypothetical protein UFOVP328_72 [uncultured Caudovirales phage]